MAVMRRCPRPKMTHRKQQPSSATEKQFPSNQPTHPTQRMLTRILQNWRHSNKNSHRRLGMITIIVATETSIPEKLPSATEREDRPHTPTLFGHPRNFRKQRFGESVVCTKLTSNFYVYPNWFQSIQSVTEMIRSQGVVEQKDTTTE